MSRTSTTKMNKFEMHIADTLATMRNLGAPFSYKFEGTKIQYRKPEKDRVYTPDFLICKPPNQLMFIETKGFFRPEARTKMIWVKKCNPTLDIRILFQKNLVINKKTGFNYKQWSKRHGYPCAFGTLPTEWFE